MTRGVPLLVSHHFAYFFPVVMYGCESWTVKKAEGQRISAFEVWCWKRLLRVPWSARRSNQSILKEINTWDFFGRNDAKAETPVLWPPHAKSWLIGKDSDAGKDLGAGGKGDDRGWDGWMASPNWWTWVWVNSGSWCWTGRPGMLWFMGSQRVGHDWATELNWTPGDLPDPGIEPVSLMSHALAGRFFITSTTWARTYSGNRTLAIDTISSCYFESLGMVHIDAPEFIIRSHHFIHHFTWLFPFPTDLILCLSLGQAFWEAFALTAYIIHLSSASYIKSIEK